MKSRKRGRSINQVEEHLSISLSLYLFTNGQIHARTQPLLWSRALHLREAPMGPVEDKSSSSITLSSSARASLKTVTKTLALVRLSLSLLLSLSLSLCCTVVPAHHSFITMPLQSHSNH
jgi:hypothetical protein